ncbi:MAG: ATP-binding cassette domain-containing protein, partial [Methanomicrobiales archaeon]|nr:ATP-binding cassette domain-containing protein [Methanomicrobiales archaeon]
MLGIAGLSKRLGDFTLTDVNLTVADAEYFIILGPTGAGKTILLETIAGIYAPDAGTITLDGLDVTATDPKDREVGMVYQDYMLFPHLTVEENIGFGLLQRKTEP